MGTIEYKSDGIPQSWSRDRLRQELESRLSHERRMLDRIRDLESERDRLREALRALLTDARTMRIQNHCDPLNTNAMDVAEKLLKGGD